MSTKSIFYVLAATILATLIVGCSGGGKKNPVLPDNDVPIPQEEMVAYIPDDLPEGSSAPMVYGIYEVEIDTQNLTGSAHPLRLSSILGESYHVDITPFLTVTPCFDCLDIKSIALSAENNLEVTFRTKHPFEPVTRYDLHVFDMRGIIVNGENLKDFSRVRLDMDGDGTRETIARANVNILLNADGYTSFYESVVEQYIGKIFDGNINPYKNLWFNPANSVPETNYNPSASPEHGFTDLTRPFGHNVFPMGGDFDDPLAETTYILKFEDTPYMNFLLILEASYGHTTRMATRKVPRFFLPEFHRKDAFSIRAELMENNLIGKQTSSSAKLGLYVSDWQAGIAATSGWDYFTSALTAIKYGSDVKEVLVDVPELLSGPVVATLSQTTSGDGSYANPYTWEIDFTNQNGADSGTYWGIVAVRDSLEGTSNGPYATSGSAMTPKRLSDVTTYFFFDVFVEEANEPPVADLEVNPDPVRVCKDVTISVGPNCLDPDGTIVMYEYDIDYSGNPTTFAADYTQNQGNPDFGQPIVMQFLETQSGNHIIGQRVTDDQGATGIDVESVQVLPNQAPNAVLQDSDADNIVDHNETVSFQPGIGTGDPDGVIVRYEYDWGYNGSNFVADVTQNSPDPNFGLPVQYTFTNTGSSDISVVVAFRVTDDGCPQLTAMTTTSFTVHPQATSGLPIMEDFETTTPGSVPNGWGVVGRYGQAYYLNSCDTGCTNNNYYWGVTNNNTLCEGGESRFLNEIGHAYTASDINECYQNRGTIVYTPEFTIPSAGANVTIRHNFNMCWSDLLGTSYLDGGVVILSDPTPGTILWNDFCNMLTSTSTCTLTYNGNNWPKRFLSPISGPNYSSVSSFTSPAHPLNGQSAHVYTSSGWVTNIYSIPSAYAGQLVRVGFLFASDDLIPRTSGTYESDCSQNLGPPYNLYIFPNFGWRINWVQIQSN